MVSLDLLAENNLTRAQESPPPAEYDGDSDEDGGPREGGRSAVSIGMVESTDSQLVYRVTHHVVLLLLLT